MLRLVHPLTVMEPLSKVPVAVLAPPGVPGAGATGEGGAGPEPESLEVVAGAAAVDVPADAMMEDACAGEIVVVEVDETSVLLPVEPVTRMS